MLAFFPMSSTIPTNSTTRPKITATLITLNEESRIGDAIRSVAWCDEVLVVDSGSQDRTVEIARQQGARVVVNAWPGFGKQKNFAQNQASHDWVLNIDADERVSPELREEILREFSGLAEGPEDPPRGYAFPRKTYYLGRWIRHGGWYPNLLPRLADRRYARWTEPEIHERLVVQGRVKTLLSTLDHFTFETIEDQILTNLRYSRFGSKDLVTRGRRASYSRLFLKPLGKFLETYFLKKGFLDGLPGLIIAINSAHSMFLKYAYLFETELHGPRDEDPHYRQLH